MKQLMTLSLATVLVLPAAQAEEHGAADQLVASKRQADMTYRQLMELMGSASALIQEGLVRENVEMVHAGTEMIADHPAPNHKPWTIMAASDQAACKQTLVSYDKVLHAESNRIAAAASARDWLTASKSAHDLTTACLTCHVMWKNKVVAKP